MSSTKAPGIYAYPLTGRDHRRSERKTDMANENGDKRIDEVAELSIDQLEDAAGGYIVVQQGVSCPYNVIDDKTGEGRRNTNDYEEAEKYCALRGYSDQRISPEEYEQKYGHRF